MHGSAVLGGYLAGGSDVDVVAVIAEPTDVRVQGRMRDRLISTARRWPTIGLEMSVITAATAAAVDPSLRGLLPDGLVRGSTVVVAGQGAGRTSLLLSLLAEATRAVSWSAIVGMPAVSLAAAGWLGVDLGRVVMVPEPGPDVAAAAATLVDGVDVVALAVPAGLPPSMYMQLSARARNDPARDRPARPAHRRAGSFC